MGPHPRLKIEDFLTDTAMISGGCLELCSDKDFGALCVAVVWHAALPLAGSVQVPSRSSSHHESLIKLAAWPSCVDHLLS